MQFDFNYPFKCSLFCLNNTPFTSNNTFIPSGVVLSTKNSLETNIKSHWIQFKILLFCAFLMVYFTLVTCAHLGIFYLFHVWQEIFLLCRVLAKKKKEKYWISRLFCISFLMILLNCSFNTHLSLYWLIMRIVTLLVQAACETLGRKFLKFVSEIGSENLAHQKF